MIMNKKTLKKLEYNKITELLAEQASSPGGKILCSHLAPMTSLAEITTAQEQTAAAFTRIVKKGRLSFSGVYTVEDPSLGFSTILFWTFFHIASH